MMQIEQQRADGVLPHVPTWTNARRTLTPLTLPGDAKSADYIQQVGHLSDGRPFVVWMTFDTNLLCHTMVVLWSGSAWRTKEVITGVRIREIERVSGNGWRVYVCRERAREAIQPNIEIYLLDLGTAWTPETTITTPKAVQRSRSSAGSRIRRGSLPPGRLRPATCRLRVGDIGKDAAEQIEVRVAGCADTVAEIELNANRQRRYVRLPGKVE